MKKFYFLVTALCLYVTTQAQNDTSEPQEKSDTIRIGRMIIIRKAGNHHDTSRVVIREKPKPPNISTTWGILDLGFSNYTDNTDYTSAETQQFAPGSNKEWFKLRNGKSVNVNIWFFMQKLNMVSHVVNLKYGLGLELNNYSMNRIFGSVKIQQRFTWIPSNIPKTNWRQIILLYP